MKASNILMTLAAGAGLAGAANAAEIFVNTNISVSTTWTANNHYNLQQQIYVLPGATLTIEAGTVLASTSNLGGSLAVCKGAQIFVNGTRDNPVIMTSTADVATWVGGDPKTGTWREACNEWGNLTIMGGAYISANNHGGATTNLPHPDANNVAPMEGLVAAFPGDTKVLYGGGNDNDDSGSVTYLSLRYGGKVLGLGNELNGLSMGAIGRATDVDHIDIMNNVDDGIETWGGTVNYKYLNVWNIGDDSFDVDEGWRGKAQFGLLVQGYSVDAAQGSGVGDNCFETDGAEDSDWQPVTTATIYNFTVVGQPVDGDHGTTWRDNARIQYRNCVFMDLGDELVRFDNTDGDGANGYGFNGTLSWANTWTTPFNMVPATPNDPANPAAFYQAQSSGFLAEITDSVFFRNQSANGYTTATTVGVLAAGTNNVLTPGFNPADAPIQSITRGPAVVRGGKTMLPVVSLDPRPANAALTSVATAPNDGFFSPVQYRGGFAPNAQSWLCGWTASNAFGFTTACQPGVAFCFPGTGGVNACPCGNPGTAGRGCNNSSSTGGADLSASGIAAVGADSVVFTTTGEKPTAFSILLQGTSVSATGSTFGQGIRCAAGSLKRLYTKAAVAGSVTMPGAGDPSVSARSAALGDTLTAGSTRYYQVYYRDPTVLGGCPGTSTFNVTNGQAIVWDM
ncbi:MAG: hypothetical protein IPJ19_15590 [Planctomycetes bacterium]|nr:hypothetical protein [Planctomycetota bacterium]